MNPSGNTILITGGASGIGLGLARALLADGNKVIVAGRREALLAQVTKGIPGLVSAVLDVSDRDAIQTFVARITQDHPDLNVLINNAGVCEVEDLTSDTVEIDVAEATMAINFMGPLQLTSALLPHLRAQANATILNVTSGLAFVPRADTPTYSASKAALHSWTQSLRHQLRATTIEVIELLPPLVDTGISPDIGQPRNERSGPNPPKGLPVHQFMDEVMALLRADLRLDEIVVDAARPQRMAEAEGHFSQIFNRINPS